jgi:hypothetical protein
MAIRDSGRSSLLTASDDPSEHPPVLRARFMKLASRSISAFLRLRVLISSTAAPLGEWETESASGIEAEEAFFRIQLQEYFSARGPEQRRRRQQVLSWMTQSKAQDANIRQVFEMVAEKGSQEVIEAAVDLLTGLGRRTERLASDLAFQPTLQNDDVAFVVALAAGRANPNVVSMLLYSKHNAIREAAVELAADMPPAQAKPILRRVAQDDSSSYLRNRAGDLLEEFD